MKRIAFTLLLFTILLSILSFSSADYVYSKDEKSRGDEVNAKKSAKSSEDLDKNKIFDDLDKELRDKPNNYQINIIVLLKVPPELVEDKVKELKGVMGEFEVYQTYSIIPGFAAKLSKNQIAKMASLDITLQIERDAEVKAFLDTATKWFRVQQARIDFQVDGDMDGSPLTYSRNDLVIAIIDSGIDPKHIDLDSGKVIGWMDVINGRKSPYDDNGHGTHVANIAAGEGEANSIYAGVAPRAALVGVKVLDFEGFGTLSGVIAGVDWVVKNKKLYGIEIMNLSLGASGCASGTDSLSLAVNNAVSNGIVAVVAAGNDGPTDCTISTPAAAEDAITVGAMADVGEKGFYLAPFSSRGPTFDGRTKPDVVAPGVAITAAASNTLKGYRTLSGTSMATPFVAGVAALMLDANPKLSPDDVKARIMGTALDWGPMGKDIDYGSGRLDAYAAVRKTSLILPDRNIGAPAHTFISDSLPNTGAIDTWTINVASASYPIAMVMIMTDWASFVNPDFDIRLFDPDGIQIASSLGVTRQETIAVSISKTGTYTVKVNSFIGNGPYILDISSGSI